MTITFSRACIPRPALHVMKMFRVEFCCVVNIMNCLAGCFLWKHKQNQDIPAVLDVEKILNLVSQMVSSYVEFVCSNSTSNTISLNVQSLNFFFMFVSLFKR